MDEREYKRLKNQIIAEFHEKIRSLETIWKIYSRSQITKKSGHSTHGEITKAVRNSINEIPQTFTPREIKAWIDANVVSVRGVKIPTISTILSRLEYEGFIQMIRRGRGRMPTTYRINPEKDVAEETVVNDELDYQ